MWTSHPSQALPGGWAQSTHYLPMGKGSSDGKMTCFLGLLQRYLAREPGRRPKTAATRVVFSSLGKRKTALASCMALTFRGTSRHFRPPFRKLIGRNSGIERKHITTSWACLAVTRRFSNSPTARSHCTNALEHQHRNITPPYRAFAARRGQ